MLAWVVKTCAIFILIYQKKSLYYIRYLFRKTAKAVINLVDLSVKEIVLFW